MPFPLDVRFVRETEAKLGRALPLGYVARMCRSNGGNVRVGQDSFQLYPILDTSDRKRLARTCNDIVRETMVTKNYGVGFPVEGLAIGNNGGGDLLVLMPDSDGKRFEDTVYWWDHETSELLFAADAFEDLQRT